MPWKLSMERNEHFSSEYSTYRTLYDPAGLVRGQLIDNDYRAAPIVQALNEPRESSDPYRDAVLVQSACNLQAVIAGWHRAITRLQREAREKGLGMEWVNSHPVNVLFAEQVYHLTGYSSRYAEALKECEAHAAGNEADKRAG